jgi:hypothetical protein
MVQVAKLKSVHAVVVGPAGQLQLKVRVNDPQYAAHFAEKVELATP